ncbi:hypothetical protein Tco_0228801 [Tanacetum coccineum]
MTGNRSKLMNFVEKFIGVYYVEGLGHNLFSVGKFCDSDLEVAFRKHTYFVRDINGTDILKGSHSTNLYTISMDEMMKSSPICLLSKASKSKTSFIEPNDARQRPCQDRYQAHPCCFSPPLDLQLPANPELFSTALNGAVALSTLNTLTYDTISSESKWKIEWLNSTEWENDIINLLDILTKSIYLPREWFKFFFHALGMKSLDPPELETLKRLQEGEDETDEQIVPRSQWLTIGKSNLLFNAQKIQKNPIFQISVDILSNTNFYQAFTASANIPAIYLQQFWNTMKYNEKTGVYSCQVVCDKSCYGKSFSRDPDIFLTQSKPHSSLKNHKKNVISSLIHYGTGFFPRKSQFLPYLKVSILGNLKFVPKGESVEVFGMAIPDPLITEAIQQSSYYPKYLEMVAENTKKTPQESASVQPATKRATPKKPTTTTPVKQSKPAPPPTKKPSKRKLPQKVRKGKPTFQLVDEDDEAQQESIPQEEDDDPDLELAKKMSLEAHQEKGEGEGDDADMERAIKLSLDPAFLPQGRAPVGGVTIRDPVSETTSKLHEVVGKGKAVVTEEQVAHSLIDLSKKKRTTDQFILVRRDQTPHDSTTGPSSQPEDDTSEKAGLDTEKAHEALAGPDPGPKQEDQTGSDSGKVHVSLAGPIQENMDDEFLATAYPKIPDTSHQTVTSTPLVIAPITDFSSPKPSSLVTPPPINTEATNCFAFRDSFILSKKRSSDSSKKLKGIQTLTPAKQEAADIMKALKESKKMSKRQPGTGGSNEGTGNILGVPDESTIVSRASSEGTGSKPGVPDEEMLILEWEADVDSEHFDRDDNAGDDNEETKPDPEEIYK